MKDLEVIARSMDRGRKTDFWLFVMSFLGFAVSIFATYAIGQLVALGVATSGLGKPVFFALTISFITAFLLYFIFYPIFDFLEAFAFSRIQRPVLTVDQNGISRFGNGVRRDVFVTWNNVEKIEVVAPQNQTVRVWIRNPNAAWRTDRFPFFLAHWFLKNVSRVVFRKRIEHAFIKISPVFLNLTVEKFCQIADEQIKASHGATNVSMDGWHNGAKENLSPKVNLLYLMPIFVMFLAFIFQPDWPPIDSSKQSRFAPYELEIKLLKVVGFMFFFMSGIIVFWRTLVRVFSRRRYTVKQTIILTVFFFGSLFMMIYGFHLGRPIEATKRGFFSYQEMRTAKKHGFYRGDKWREDLLKRFR